MNAAAGLDMQKKARIKSAVWMLTRWEPGEVVTVAFRAGMGSTEIRDSIARSAAIWSEAANLTFDFWTSPDRKQYREWAPTDTAYRADVRIAFVDTGDVSGYWSLLGNDARDTALAGAGEPTMNLEAFDRGLPNEWHAIVLHEFGHALSFVHEHQSPLSTCEAEFRFEDDSGYVLTLGPNEEAIEDTTHRQPGLYTVLGNKPDEWRREKVDANLRQFAYNDTLWVDAFDSSSIMKYYFKPSLFLSGATSKCYSPQALALSDADRAAAKLHYPRGAALMATREGLLRDSLAALDLPATTRKRIVDAFARMAQRSPRGTRSPR